MLLKLDENNYIEGYATIGGIEGAVEVDLTEDDIPFPYYEAYQYIDGKIILDQNKLNELKAEEDKKPLSEVDELKQRVASLEKLVESLLQRTK